MNDWLDFISSLVDSLAWPAALAAIVFLLRHEIRMVIPALRRLRLGQFQMDFGEEVRQLEEMADQAAIPQAETSISPELRAASSFEDLPPGAVRGSVLDEWQAVEARLSSLAAEAGLDPDTNLHQLLIELRERDALTEGTYTVILELRRLRNLAVHSRGFGMSAGDAELYASLVARLLKALS